MAPRSSFGDRLADRIASFGGSWKFIIMFGTFLSVWITLNSIFPHPIDKYPYILLNLFLSMIAALQAPVIMMSQNRADAKDRKKADMDYKVNLKNEELIRELHNKVDQLLKINK